MHTSELAQALMTGPRDDDPCDDVAMARFMGLTKQAAQHALTSNCVSDDKDVGQYAGCPFKLHCFATQGFGHDNTYNLNEVQDRNKHKLNKAGQGLSLELSSGTRVRHPL